MRTIFNAVNTVSVSCTDAGEENKKDENVSACAAATKKAPAAIMSVSPLFST
jgi:hypothetical protein